MSARDIDYDIRIVILRLLQMKSKDLSIKFPDEKQPRRIDDISFNGRSLSTDMDLLKLDLSKITKEDAIRLTNDMGYVRVYLSKTDISVNGKNLLIRSSNHNSRPLINHSTRAKFLSICKRLNIDIGQFDKVVREYWDKRRLGIINEDVSNSSDYSPFAKYKDYLTPILSEMVFSGINTNRYYCADYYLDFVYPYDDTTWRIYSRQQYIDEVWEHLRFSFRADRGMPSNYDPNSQDFKDIHPWTVFWNSQYKGALHIRVINYESDNPKAPVFLVKNKAEIDALKLNKGEQDETLIKFYFVYARMNKYKMPIGKEICEIESVGDKDHDFLDLPILINWSSISDDPDSPAIITSICHSCHISKAGRFDKADVFVNHIGISLKSQAGGYPTIINQTRRSKILRVMLHFIHMDIKPLDQMVESYWQGRLNHSFGEDVKNDDPHSPFRIDFGAVLAKEYLKPLLNYFSFDGTGTRLSLAPAKLILDFNDPFDSKTWSYFDKNNYVDLIFNRLVFSIRGKGLIKDLPEEDLLWIKEINNQKKGTLNVRISK